MGKYCRIGLGRNACRPCGDWRKQGRLPLLDVAFGSVLWRFYFFWTTNCWVSPIEEPAFTEHWDLMRQISVTLFSDLFFLFFFFLFRKPDFTITIACPQPGVYQISLRNKGNIQYLLNPTWHLLNPTLFSNNNCYGCHLRHKQFLPLSLVQGFESLGNKAQYKYLTNSLYLTETAILTWCVIELKLVGRSFLGYVCVLHCFTRARQ